MSLTQVVVNTKAFNGLISTFGEGVNDLLITIGDMKIDCAVDVATHYCSKSMPVVLTDGFTYKPGELYISDLHKVSAFLKTCKEELTTIRHVGDNLTIVNGNDTFTTPTHKHIMSYVTVAKAREAIMSGKNNDWTKLGRAELQCHGTLNSVEFDGIASMMKVTGKDAPVRVTIADGEMTITAGSKRGARINRTIPVDVKESSQVTETIFSSDLPKLLSAMPTGEIIFHMGNKSALVMLHGEIDATLILKHQEGVDE